jgi:hypothetical protein
MSSNSCREDLPETKLASASKYSCADAPRALMSWALRADVEDNDIEVENRA